MSTLSVTTINTANGTTDLTMTSGNTAGGKIIVSSNGGLVLQGNSSTNTVNISATSMSVNAAINVINSASFSNTVTVTGNATFSNAVTVAASGIKFSDSTVQTTAATSSPSGSIALAWVSFTGNTGTIRASYNVSSVTRNGTGDYSINFTTPLTDANYSVSLTGSATYGTAYSSGYINNAVAPTTSVLRVLFLNTVGGGASSDPTYGNVIVFR